MRTSCAASCSGLSTGIAAIVVQFGLATMPRTAWSSACGLTSLTTSGTSGSIRKALELSMTSAPASAKRCAWARLVVAPALNRAMSRPLGSAVAASSTVTSAGPPRPSQGRVDPALRALAK